MRKTVGTLLGKSVAGAVKLRGKSGGQAMPGLVVEAFIPGYLGVMLKQLPEGVVIITGTNGKTTTTKMVVEILRANGKQVLTNSTGSNLTRGIISSVSQQANHTGKLPFDIAIFELDEAYARQFTDVMRPSYVLGLNASRDQLDRFGEVDKVAGLIGETMLSATKGIITNADDKRLSMIAERSDVPVTYFGLAKNLRKFFPRDDELVSVSRQEDEATLKPEIAVKLIDFKGDSATYELGKSRLSVTLQVTGQHNFQNAAAVLALAQLLLPNVGPDRLGHDLANVKPAFGRGQTFTLKDGSSLQLNLVKNPASFRQGLASYVRPKTSVMVAINDRVADSRDMSWLWDVDFSSLKGHNVALASGSRAVDIALRLQYDEIAVLSIESDLDSALKDFCNKSGNKVIFATYTAMLHLHAVLSKKSGRTL